MKKAFITGITGQDGSYLAEFLLNKGYQVYGLIRRVALEDPDIYLGRIKHLSDKITLYSGEISNYSRISELIDLIEPDECYHLAAQSFVYESFNDPFTTNEFNIGGTLNILKAIKEKSPKTKLYFAATSEMFGKVVESPQKETTKFYPRSPYGVSKVAGFDYTRNFRESYHLFLCSGILFNHESPRRGKEFVTRKITSFIADMKAGKENVGILGNLDSQRDWGYAEDYVRAMWLMLQQEKPEDYVIATGETHSIKEFLDIAFNHAGISYEIINLSHMSEELADEKIAELKNKSGYYIVQHPRFYRPAEVDVLTGDATKAKEKLGWVPHVSFKELVEMMVESDLKEKGIEINKRESPQQTLEETESIYESSQDFDKPREFSNVYRKEF